jgi:hypothetical protein
MARRNRRREDAAAAMHPAPSAERREQWRGEEYAVRSVTGSGGSKYYRCPGCDQQIRPGQPHLVTWPAFDAEAADRRHWHAPCWAARERRGPGVQRGRSAPRY